MTSKYAKPSYEGFRDFIAAQPSDRTIIQSSWEKCAVGDYLNSLRPEGRPVSMNMAAEFSLQLPEAMFPADECGFRTKLCGCGTYGEAQQLLEEFPL